jgi:predicted MFS family arabinose efflux permease
MGWVAHTARLTGFHTLVDSSRDVKLMCVQRFVRMFAYGSCFLILVRFFSSLGISDDQIGLFMTLTLLGDAVISLVLTLITDNVGRKSVLVMGSAGMIFSGFVFVSSSNYWILLIASIFGVISPR